MRGYPPVLGAMLLVDGVLTVILGGDATVSLGEVVAYLLLPPLAMYLVTQSTGGRRPNAVTLGAAGVGGVVLFAALFLGGGVHLLTLPGWALVVVGLLFLGVAVLLMRRQAAPAQQEIDVAPLLSPAERDEFTQRDEYGEARRDGGYGEAGRDGGYGEAGRDEYGGFGDGGYGGGGRGEYGGYGERPDAEWLPSRRDDAYPADRATDDTVQGLPRVPPTHSAGPPEPEWPPRRDPGWPDGAQPANAAEPQPTWTDGPADREWPPAPAHDWPPRRDPEPAPGGGQRSWFESEEPEPAEPSWSPGPPDSEWPPADRQGGRRSRHPDE